MSSPSIIASKTAASARGIRVAATTVLLLTLVPSSGPVFAADAPGANDAARQTAARRNAATERMAAKDFAAAWPIYRQLVLAPDADPATLEADLGATVFCMNNLRLSHEIDPLREQIVALHRDEWRILKAVAGSYFADRHYGSLVGGTFLRGVERAGALLVNAFDRDRVRALQLLAQALPLADADPDREAAASCYLFAAGVLLGYNGYADAWRMEALTDLSRLPDYDAAGWQRAGDGAFHGAPTRADGTPVLYGLPASFEAAASDGERRRWMLDAAARAAPKRTNDILMERASCLRAQLGVQTLATRRDYLGATAATNTAPVAADEWSVSTLSEDESLAQLAGGVKRFALPDEADYIAMLRRVADHPETGYGDAALDTLADIFVNRRQYEKAAECLRRAIAAYGAGDEGSRALRLHEIKDGWGRIEPTVPGVAGNPVDVEYRFRNSRSVSCTAYRIRCREMLDDAVAYLESNPLTLDTQRIEVELLGVRVVKQGDRRYVGDAVARWTVPLTPAADHHDRRVTLRVPIDKAGVYLLEAHAENGNISRIVIRIEDTVLVRKPVEDGLYVYVADARTGHPVPGAVVEFAGYRVARLPQPDGNRHQNIVTTRFHTVCDTNGQAIARDTALADQSYKWLVRATTPDGRLAYTGFDTEWRGGTPRTIYDQSRAFGITDRPRYRPGDSVHYTFCVRRAAYALGANASTFAGRPFTVRLLDPRGVALAAHELTTGSRGELSGAFDLSATVGAGTYSLEIQSLGDVRFEVGGDVEPARPFAVAVEPARPTVAPGETIEAEIRAREPDGHPVAAATAIYRVWRYEPGATTYPPAAWDWLYGPGYGWPAPGRDWYPGWAEWGRPPPPERWQPDEPNAAELVAEAYIPLDTDGRATVRYDTAFDTAVGGSGDSRYTLSVTVRDDLTRTSEGAAVVDVRRQPFDVCVRIDRGHYAAGDSARVTVSALSPDGRVLAGRGLLRLNRIAYTGGEPAETASARLPISVGGAAPGMIDIPLTQAGQYRVVATVTNEAGDTASGGCLLDAFSPDGNAPTNAYRFNALELIPDRRTYRPGETAAVRINTEHADSTVLLFARGENGVYHPPRLLRLSERTAVELLVLSSNDVPNLHLEAVSISGGELLAVAREVRVPPADRTLHVELEPDAAAHRPGETATIRVRVTDPDGKPCAATLTTAVYDRSLAAVPVVGRSTADLRSFYWGWLRRNLPFTSCSLSRCAFEATPPSELPMEALGLFGEHLPGDSANRVRLQAQAPSSGPPEGTVAPFRGAADSATGRIPSAEPATALWMPAIQADTDGGTVLTYQVPDADADWHATVWAVAPGTRVGQGQLDIAVRKPLRIELAGPRRAVTGDSMEFSARLSNGTTSALPVEARLECASESLAFPGDTARRLTLPQGGEERVRWPVTTVREGRAAVVATTVALAAKPRRASDRAVAAVAIHESDDVQSRTVTGIIPPGADRVTLTATVPFRAAPRRSRLEIRWTPSIADALRDAVAYLDTRGTVDDIAAGTQETLDRFLPALVAQSALGTTTNGDTSVQQAARLGVRRLAAMQVADGGWGWLSGPGETSDPVITARVVSGLRTARDAGVDVAPAVIENGMRWLFRHQEWQCIQMSTGEQQGTFKTYADDVDAYVYRVLIDAEHEYKDMLERLYRDRERLSVRARALFAAALNTAGHADKLAIVMRMLDDDIAAFVTPGRRKPPTTETTPWRWANGEFETQAECLGLLTLVDPHGERTARMAERLVAARPNATHWNSRRDTALCVEALAAYERACATDGTKEAHPPIELFLDGQRLRTASGAEMATASTNRCVMIAGDALRTGARRIDVRCPRRPSPLYISVTALYPAAAETRHPWPSRAGLTINRALYRVGRDGTAAPELLKATDALRVGEQVDIELRLEAGADCEQVVVDGPAAAGLEPLDRRDGYVGRLDTGAYRVLRDDGVRFLIPALRRGTRRLVYRARATTPGTFTLRAATARAAYAPADLHAQTPADRLVVIAPVP